MSVYLIIDCTNDLCSISDELASGKFDYWIISLPFLQQIHEERRALRDTERKIEKTSFCRHLGDKCHTVIRTRNLSDDKTDQYHTFEGLTEGMVL